jgi:hydroxymethylglutaryl-CoA lyase
MIRSTTVALAQSLLRKLPTPRLFSTRCKIVEVGPRDGLQNESAIVSTETKVSLIHMLTEAGCATVEVGAFVSPKWVPQMADSGEVLEMLHANDGVSYSCLVPNVKGMMALAALHSNKCTEVAIFASASESFSQRNINCTIAESMERFLPVMDLALEKSLPVRGYVSCVVGCPYEGNVPLDNVLKVSQQLLDMGCFEISLGDTIGVGTPKQVKEMLQVVQVRTPWSNGFVTVKPSLTC